jgi:hypothetical protein
MSTGEQGQLNDTTEQLTPGAMDALSNSIDVLYRAFDDVAKPRHVDGCPCCIEKKEIEVLLSTPLREIPPDALG